MGGGRAPASPTPGHSLWTSRGTLIWTRLSEASCYPWLPGRGRQFPVLLLLRQWSNRLDPGHCLFRAGAWTAAAPGPHHTPSWSSLLGTASSELSYHQHLVPLPQGSAITTQWFLGCLGCLGGPRLPGTQHPRQGPLPDSRPEGALQGSSDLVRRALVSTLPCPNPLWGTPFRQPAWALRPPSPG